MNPCSLLHAPCAVIRRWNAKQFQIRQKVVMAPTHSHRDNLRNTLNSIALAHPNQSHHSTPEDQNPLHKRQEIRQKVVILAPFSSAFRLPPSAFRLPPSVTTPSSPASHSQHNLRLSQNR